MNFQQLEYVIAVDKHRHFARAAESCHVTQATLSAMIKKLEQELEVTLFDRSTHPVLTTEEGKKVIAMAKEILKTQGKLLQLNETNTKILDGQISIGVIPTIANSLLPRILPSIMEAHPELTLDIHEITTEEIIRQLKSDRLDMGILATPLEDKTIEEHILYYESMMVYGVKESKKKKYMIPQDLKDQSVWLLEEGHCFKNQSMTICNMKEKIDMPGNLQFAGSSFETLLNLTDQFGGYTLIPELYYHQLTSARKKKTRPFELPIPVREVSLVHYRPLVKKHSISILADEIRDIIPSQLITASHETKDLSVIGI